MYRWLKTHSLALLLLASIGPVGVLHAEMARPPLFQLAQLGPLPPDQRREMRQQMREHWQQMPREERQDLRERNREARREQRDGFQQMPQEDRSRVREELRGRRDNWQNAGPNGGQNGGPGGGFQQNDGRGGGHGRGRR